MNALGVIDCAGDAGVSAFFSLFALKPGSAIRAHEDGTPMNKQEALEASNRAVVERLLKKEGLL